MRIQLSDHFTYGRLFRFTFPSIIMMVFTSIYSVVDGFFISNYVGKVPFAALNLVMPLFIILGSVGFMLGSGGNAIVARTLGEGDRSKANRYFSFLVLACMGLGLLVFLVGFASLSPIARFLGASGEILGNSVLYGRIVLCGMPFFMLQNLFQSFCITAERPKLGLAFTVASGLANMILDALFVAVFKWGLAGAAWATVISEVVGGLGPVFYFLRPNASLLRLGRTRWYGRVLLQSCFNGSSELMSNIAASIVSVLYNWQLLSYAGPDGVAAYGVLMYISFFFSAMFIGYAVGVSPVVGFHYGAGNKKELKNLLHRSFLLIGVSGICMWALASLSAPLLCRVFVGYDENLYRMTVWALRIHAFCFLLGGFNIFTSSFFTALNNGGVSALVSFLRTLVFETGSVELLPLALGLNGIWAATVIAESAALTVSLLCLFWQRPRYGY